MFKWLEIYIRIFETEITLSESKMIQNNFYDVL